MGKLLLLIMCKRMFSLTVIVFFILEICVFPAHAAILDLDTYDLSEEEKTVIIQNTNLEVLNEDTHKGGIQCFDVNENGSYALGIDAGSNCIVYVYDPNNVFLYGYKFYCDGDYAIGFHEELISIYFLRGNTIALYDAAGTCTSIQRVDDSNRNFICVNEILDRTSMEAGGKQYMLERDIDIGDSYSRFVSVSKSGERTVLFDVSSEHTLGQFVLLLAVCGFFLFVIVGVYRKLIDTKNL